MAFSYVYHQSRCPAGMTNVKSIQDLIIIPSPCPLIFLPFAQSYLHSLVSCDGPQTHRAIIKLMIDLGANLDIAYSPPTPLNDGKFSYSPVFSKDFEKCKVRVLLPQFFIFICTFF